MSSMTPSTSGDGALEANLSIYDSRSSIYHDLYQNEIRLVKLLSGQWHDKIYCQLYHAPLVNRPEYKALSYAWGSPRATRPIFVNGHQHLVTVNLESALRRLRQIDSDVTLWIDAICINQKNDLERTAQVNLMHDIYALTQEVIIYLGEVPQDGSIASNKSLSSSTATFYYDDRDGDKLGEFRSFCHRETPSISLKSQRRGNYEFDVFCFLRLLAEEPDMNHLPSFDPNSRQFLDTKYQRNLFEGLRQMLLCRWWNRIWVIQEVVVPKTVTVVYGSAAAPWGMFVNAARWYSRNRSASAPVSFPHEYSTVIAYFARIILDIDTMRELWRDGKQTALLPLLRRFSGRKASDDRDKVYALLSLVRNQTSIIPDYAFTVPAVFQNTVLDIIKTTKSLTALTGDLGRKDRQDLPSWVPDWSATYDDLDRRRAENSEHYRATNGSLIYVQDEGERWSGIRQYLGNTECPSDIKRFNAVLGTSDWLSLLPEGDHDPDEDTCLAAIEKFCAARGIVACLKEYGSGVIRLAGLHIDTITITAETAFSDDMLLSVIHSWATLLGNHFLNNNYDRSNAGLGDAFRRTLCANTILASSSTEVFATRGINNYDQGLIATWFLQGIEPQAILDPMHQWNLSWKKLFQDLGDPSSYIPPKPISPTIDAAIRSATVRRTFFITDRGYIGLGPTKVRQGDHLYVLLGGQTPFILRDVGFRKFSRVPNKPRLGIIERQCFNVVGDCYTHGLMDGEAMNEWKKIVGIVKKDNARLQRLSKRRKEMNQQRKTLNADLFAWRRVIDDGISLHKLVVYDDSDSLRLAEGYESVMEYISDLSIWKYQFESGDMYWKLELTKAAMWNVKQMENYMAYMEREMDKIAGLIGNYDEDTIQKWHVYLS